MNLVDGIATIGDTDPLVGATPYPSIDAFVTELGAIGDDTGCAIQPFHADYIVDRAHLESAVEHANRAVARGDAIADVRAVEILCYAAGRRQIQQAMTIGVDPGHTPVVVVCDDGTLGRPPDTPSIDAGDEADAADRVKDHVVDTATLGETDEDAIRSFFEISDAELAAIDGDLSLLVRERVALLDVDK